MVVVGWAVEDKEAPFRVCSSLVDGAHTNVECKLSDATANLYLSLAGLLACGLDGVVRNLELRPPLGKEISSPQLLPASVEESLNCLEKDKFLEQIIGPQLLRAYLALRRVEAELANGKSLELELQTALQRA